LSFYAETGKTIFSEYTGDASTTVHLIHLVEIKKIISSILP
jgi:hypothetical protein